MQDAGLLTLLLEVRKLTNYGKNENGANVEPKANEFTFAQVDNCNLSIYKLLKTQTIRLILYVLKVYRNERNSRYEGSWYIQGVRWKTKQPSFPVFSLMFEKNVSILFSNGQTFLYILNLVNSTFEILILNGNRSQVTPYFQDL